MATEVSFNLDSALEMKWTNAECVGRYGGFWFNPGRPEVAPAFGILRYFYREIRVYYSE